MLVLAQPLVEERPPVALAFARARDCDEAVVAALQMRPGARPEPVEARAADAREGAHPLDRRALRRSFTLRMRHRLDLGEDAVAPGPMLGGSDASMRRKACLKKSRSSCCWPTFL